MEWIIIMAIVAWAIMFTLKAKTKKTKEERKVWDVQNKKSEARKTPTIEKAEPATTNNKKQLDNVLKNKYEKQKLFNKTEEDVFKIVMNLINTHAKGHYRINGQTSLGEILTCKDRAAFFAINAKRVDMLIINREMEPIAAIEVNGTGHYQDDALERDEIKRAAIESAGIKYIAIRENENAKEKLERELIHILAINQPRKITTK